MRADVDRGCRPRLARRTQLLLALLAIATFVGIAAWICVTALDVLKSTSYASTVCLSRDVSWVRGRTFAEDVANRQVFFHTARAIGPPPAVVVDFDGVCTAVPRVDASGRAECRASGA